MTDMQRYDVNDDGFQTADERGPFVLYSDAEAAIAAAENAGYHDCAMEHGFAVVQGDGQSLILASECEERVAAAVDDFRAAMSEGTWYQSGREAGFEDGEREMLARCIAAVEALTPDETGVVLRRRHAIAALRALGGSDD